MKTHQHKYIPITEKELQELFSVWARRFKLSVGNIKRDNRIKYVGIVYWNRKSKIHDIYYNFKHVENDNPTKILSLIFHELGHIRYKTHNITDKIRSEYLAEKFKLIKLKYHFSQYFMENVELFKNILKDIEWQRHFPKHYQAFKRIKEYNEQFN